MSSRNTGLLKAPRPERAENLGSQLLQARTYKSDKKHLPINGALPVDGFGHGSTNEHPLRRNRWVKSALKFPKHQRQAVRQATDGAGIASTLAPSAGQATITPRASAARGHSIPH